MWIDDREVRTGSRDDGTVYSVYSFARKIGQALAGGLMALRCRPSATMSWLRCENARWWKAFMPQST